MPLKEVKMPLQEPVRKPLERLTTNLGVSYEDLPQILGADRNTVSRLIADETISQSYDQARLDALRALVARLEENFTTPEGAVSWLQAESGYLGERPIDAFLQGRIDAVDAALEALDS